MSGHIFIYEVVICRKCTEILSHKKGDLPVRMRVRGYVCDGIIMLLYSSSVLCLWWHLPAEGDTSIITEVLLYL